MGGWDVKMIVGYVFNLIVGGRLDGWAERWDWTSGSEENLIYLTV